MNEKRFGGAEGDDERDLINAEFESMVADLNLDQSSPTTYLDSLDALDREESAAIFEVPHVKKGFQQGLHDMVKAISRWWRRDGDQRENGAQV